MTTNYSQIYNAQNLTAVALISGTNVSSTYSNGPTNNGVGATLTVAASSLTIDSVVTVVGDRVLLAGQTSSFQNGIYQVTSIGTTVVLTRSGDFQSIEQMQLGATVAAYAGTGNAGRTFTLISPLPGAVGVDGIVFSAPTAAVSGATVLNHIAVFADTVGTIKESVGVTAIGGDIQAGLSGTAGAFASFPSAASKGSLKLVAVANTGDTLVTISNALHGQASVYSIPDSGAATANFIISAKSGGQTISTGGLAVAGGSISAGVSGTAGTLTSFPATVTTGSLRLTAVSNSGDFLVTLSNRSHGQATVYSLADVGAATGSILNCAVAADPASNLIWSDTTVAQASLAAGGAVALITSSGSKQYKVREIMHNNGGTAFSGGGGDRLGQVGDGTSIYCITPAASLQTIVNARWGSTAIAFPTAIAANTSTAAGANLSYKYNSGTTDYTAGTFVVTVMVQRVA